MMLNATTFSASATVATAGGGTISPDISTVTNELEVGTVQAVAISTTPQAVLVPQGAVALTVQMPANNQIVVTLKGSAADVGVPLHPLFGLPCLSVDASAGPVTLYFVGAAIGTSPMSVTIG
jgi:hypothetical protein